MLSDKHDNEDEDMTKDIDELDSCTSPLSRIDKLGP